MSIREEGRSRRTRTSRGTRGATLFALGAFLLVLLFSALAGGGAGAADAPPQVGQSFTVVIPPHTIPPTTIPPTTIPPTTTPTTTPTTGPTTPTTTPGGETPPSKGDSGILPRTGLDPRLLLVGLLLLAVGLLLVRIERARRVRPALGG